MQTPGLPDSLGEGVGSDECVPVAVAWLRDDGVLAPMLADLPPPGPGSAEPGDGLSPAPRLVPCPALGPVPGPDVDPVLGSALGPVLGPALGPMTGPVIGLVTGPVVGLETGPVVGLETGAVIGLETGAGTMPRPDVPPVGDFPPPLDGLAGCPPPGARSGWSVPLARTELGTTLPIVCGGRRTIGTDSADRTRKEAIATDNAMTGSVLPAG